MGFYEGNSSANELADDWRMKTGAVHPPIRHTL